MAAPKTTPRIKEQAPPALAIDGLLSVGGKPDHGMDYGTFMATEGGRKCPICGRYAKAGTVGNLSFVADIGGGIVHISMYGHLPGYGCNISDNSQAQTPNGSA